MVEAPSLLNLIGGAMVYGQEGEDKEETSKFQTQGAAAMAVGGSWLVTTIGISAFYKPYRSAYLLTKKMPAKTKREKLMRERIAEAALADASSLAKKIKYFSVVTNLAAAGIVIGSSESDSATLVGVAAAFGSILPLLFPYKWEKNYSRHEQYKKRIYGPVAQSDILYNQHTKKFAPGLKLSLQF